MSDGIRIGVVGLRRGMVLARVAHANPSARVTAVCDRNRGRAEDAAKQFGAVAFTDFGEMLESSVDAVLIATPPISHSALTCQSAAAGVHVMCEVPAVAAPDEVSHLLASVRDAGIEYMIAENVCYFPNIESMKTIVDSGRVGEVYYAEGEYVHDCRGLFVDRDDGLGGGVDGKVTWRVGLPPIHYCTHEIGPLLMITGDPITEAVALDTGSRIAHGYGAIDMESALFRTKSGAVVKLLCGFAVAREPAHHFLSLYGTLGSVETDRYRPNEFLKAYFEEDPGSESLTDIAVTNRHDDELLRVLPGGHGTSEYYMVAEFIRRIAGDVSNDTGRRFLGVEDALNMSLPGLYAHLSAQQNGDRLSVPVY